LEVKKALKDMASRAIDSEEFENFREVAQQKEKERDELKTKLRLLKIGVTFAMCDLEAARRYTKVTEDELLEKTVTTLKISHEMKSCTIRQCKDA